MHKEIFEKFKKIGMKYFYGDFFDSRVYVSHNLRKIQTINILDIGCGSGVLLSCAPECQKIGIDVDFEALKEIKKLDKKIEPILCDAQFLPLKNNIFETISAMHLFPVIKNMKGDWNKAIEEVLRVSKDKSTLLITGANSFLVFEVKTLLEKW